MLEHSESARRNRLVDDFQVGSISALLVTSPVNVRYLSGFTGSNGGLLIGAGLAVLATDGRYAEQAARETRLTDIVVTRSLVDVLVRRAADAGVVLGVERDDLTLARFEEVTLAAGAMTVVPVSGEVEKLRRVKDDVELAALRAAAVIADRAFATVSARLRPGVTERQIAADLDSEMRRLGADDIAFATIVAAGPNGSEPHHQPTDYRVVEGDLVTVDMGALLNGYHSDMTRTVCVGAPAPWQREIYALVQAAQLAGRAAVQAGLPAAGVDAAARQVIEAAGHGEHFVHGVGHGVGLQIHEAPMLFGDSEVVLSAGMVVTVEPGVYLPGRGGVRIEDTVVVGTGEVLTKASYDGALSVPVAV